MTQSNAREIRRKMLAAKRALDTGNITLARLCIAEADVAALEIEHAMQTVKGGLTDEVEVTVS